MQQVVEQERAKDWPPPSTEDLAEVARTTQEWAETLQKANNILLNEAITAEQKVQALTELLPTMPQNVLPVAARALGLVELIRGRHRERAEASLQATRPSNKERFSD